MKRILSTVICLCLATAAFAQGFGSRLADVDLDFELGESPFSLAPVSYIYFGFNGLTNSDADLRDKMGFFQSQQLGVNLVEFAVRPFEGGRLSLGVDFSSSWYQMNKDYMWYTYDYKFLGAVPVPKENGLCVSIAPKELFAIKEVKQSTLAVSTFGFPLNFSYTFGRFTVLGGGTLEVNLDGVNSFKGVDLNNNGIDDRRSGMFFSKKIGVNRVTFDVHAGFSYGGLGLYFKYNPLPKFYMGTVDGKEVICGPQFQSWTVALILGLGV